MSRVDSIAGDVAPDFEFFHGIVTELVGVELGHAEIELGKRRNTAAARRRHRGDIAATLRRERTERASAAYTGRALWADMRRSFLDAAVRPHGVSSIDAVDPCR
ncbi:hypothetical protein [Sorangium sp. So ce394]|uniref:hypothetical protein n=1 Tax=Sorangium sp. So ce394 TaxID=3133310 RepID=UPI003F5C3CD2